MLHPSSVYPMLDYLHYIIPRVSVWNGLGMFGEAGGSAVSTDAWHFLQAGTGRLRWIVHHGYACMHRLLLGCNLSGGANDAKLAI